MLVFGKDYAFMDVNTYLIFSALLFSIEIQYVSSNLNLDYSYVPENRESSGLPFLEDTKNNA